MASFRAFHAFVALLGVPLLGPACGGSGSGSDTGPKLSEVPATLATASCNVLARCLGPAYDPFLAGQSCTDRLTVASEEGEFSLIQSAIDAHRVTYDGTKVAACLSAIDAAGCTVFTKRLTTECAGVLTGTVASGGDCTLNAECHSGLFCQADSTCPGKCTALLGAGSACKVSDSCQDGLLCSDKSKTCIKPAKEGEPCGASATECPVNLVCVGPTATQPGTCKSIDSVFAAAEGAACDAPNSVLCQKGLSCAISALDQQGKLVWKCEKPATSQTCHVGYPETCPSGQFCQLAGTTVDSGSCQPLPGDGEACASQTPSDPMSARDHCASTTTCVGATCKAIQHLNGACTTDAECFSKLCKTGKCVPSECGDAPTPTR